jgi:hypothetical protein
MTILIKWRCDLLPKNTRGEPISASAWGFGVPKVATMIRWTLGTGPSSLLKNALVANSPQLLVSVIYIMFNSLFTRLAIAVEWNSYSIRRKGLRVSSDPKGAQRQTYFLELPCRYSFFIVSASAGLHWLVSQTIFVVALEGYRVSEHNLFEMESTGYLSSTICGWSPLPAILVLTVGFVITFFTLITGLFRLHPYGMPIAGSCSAAIAAACHPERDEPNAWEKPVKWGAIKSKDGETEHCSFSSLQVRPPKVGTIYK